MAEHRIFVSYNQNDKDVKSICYDFKGLKNYEEDLKTVFINYDQSENLVAERGNPANMTEEEIFAALDREMAGCDVTIVLLSPNMMDSDKPEREQWLPWEIAYSMNPSMRADPNVLPNAVLAIAVPDEDGKYDHVYDKGSNRNIHLDCMPPIVRGNMLNIREPKIGMDGKVVVTDDSNYFPVIKWSYFHANSEHYIDLAVRHRNNAQAYNLVTKVE